MAVRVGLCFASVIWEVGSVCVSYLPNLAAGRSFSFGACTGASDRDGASTALAATVLCTCAVRFAICKSPRSRPAWMTSSTYPDQRRRLRWPYGSKRREHVLHCAYSRADEAPQPRLVNMGPDTTVTDSVGTQRGAQARSRHACTRTSSHAGLVASIPVPGDRGLRAIGF